MNDHPVDRARRLLESFGNQLHEVRLARELTLRDLAEQTGIGAPDLTRIEHAKVVPTPAQLQILRDWLLQRP